MTRSRTIVLELLREGPPHNQLLSPLTRYLAACQNRPPESLRLSVEHRAFLRWQDGLTYARAQRDQAPESKASVETDRRNAIDDASEAVTRVLGSIRALVAELAAEPCEWRHIHLVVDASELGALPFELARAAPGLMVEGERLFLQQNIRVTLTRQTRRVPTTLVAWPSRPRILCVIGDGNLTVRAHVLALRKSIDPWIGFNDADPTAEDADDESSAPTTQTEPTQLTLNRKAEAAQMLTVLTNPTLEMVAEEARKVCYTHVHVLAHGAPLPDAGAGQTLYGLRFRGIGENAIDVVDGDRLESALRHPRHAECHHPTVVTLATCEGGNISGAILGPGASAAHAIHAKGVPLVVASQFPLTMDASVIATEMLYRGLMRGEDPRETTHAIRRELLVSHPATHDWASLVLYGSFPADLDRLLGEVRQATERLAAEAAVERLRVTLLGRSASRLDPNSSNKDDKLRDRVIEDVERLDAAVAAIRAWTAAGVDTAKRIRGYRLVARIAMRLWDILKLRKTPFDTSVSEKLGREKKHDFASGVLPISMFTPDGLLQLAKDSYEAAHQLDGSSWELWVQVVALCWALKKPAASAAARKQYNDDLKATRYMASLLVDRADQATSDVKEKRALAAAIAFEAELLAYLSGAENRAPETTFDQAIDQAFDVFVRRASPVPESYRAYAMRRQLRRYKAWAGETTPPRHADDPAGVTRTPRLPTTYLEKLKDLGVRTYWGPRA